MAINVDGAPIVLQKMQAANDSLKFADMQKTFSIIDEIPTTDIVATDDNPAYDAQVNDILNTLKALQVARKSLSDIQSVAKDIKSNYKTEKNDAWAPVDDTMLKQRYEATQQIKDILKNATLNHKNVFTMDYAKDGIILDLGRKDMSALNLRDEHSINIFTHNIEQLSKQIEDNVQKLQGKIDQINKSRWLSMENLRNVRLQQKEVNAGLKAVQATPSLASALAEIAQQAMPNVSTDSAEQNMSALSNALATSKDNEILTQDSNNQARSLVPQDSTESNTDNTEEIDSNTTISSAESMKEDSNIPKEKSLNDEVKANATTQDAKAKDSKEEVIAKVDDKNTETPKDTPIKDETTQDSQNEPSDTQANSENKVATQDSSTQDSITQDSTAIEAGQKSDSAESTSNKADDTKEKVANQDTIDNTAQKEVAEEENKEQVIDVFV